jgi:nucleoside 2-deoxyribosyltransferase
MMHKKVYLAGPIGGSTYDEAQNWRMDLDHQLQSSSNGAIRGYSPLRGKGALKHEGPLTTSAYPFYSPLATSKAILSRDFNDCRTADLIIANLLEQDEGAPPSLGTIMEIGFGFALQVPILAISKDRSRNSIAKHAMVVSAVGFWVDSLNEAADVACSILLP